MIYLLFGQVDLRGPVWWFQNPEMSSARKFASAPHNHLSSSPNLSAAGGSREICVNLWRTSWRSCCRTRRRRRRTLTQFLRVVVSVTLSELSSFDFWAKKRNFRLAKILWGASKSTWALLNLPFQPTLNATDEESQSSTSLNWLGLRNKIHKFYLSAVQVQIFFELILKRLDLKACTWAVYFTFTNNFWFTLTSPHVDVLLLGCFNFQPDDRCGDKHCGRFWRWSHCFRPRPPKPG